MSTTRESGEDEDHLSPQEKMISRLIIKSQDEMFHRFEKSQDDMFYRLESMLCKVLVQPPHKDSEILKSAGSSSYCASYDIDDHVKTNPLFESEEKTSKNEDEKMKTDVDVDDENSEEPEQDTDQYIFEFGLFEAAKSGDWPKASNFFEKNPQVMMTNENCKIGLRIAILNNRLPFVKKFVELLPSEALEHKIKDNGFTALHTAAAYGYSEIAKVLVTKNPNLTQIRDKKGRVPLLLSIQAVTLGQKATVKYLYSVTKDEEPSSSPFSGTDGAKLLCTAIDANFYDIALLVLKKNPELLTKKQLITGNNDPSKHVHNPCALASMIQRPLAFYSGAKLTWWQHNIYSCKSIIGLTLIRLQKLSLIIHHDDPCFGFCPLFFIYINANVVCGAGTNVDMASTCNHDSQEDEQNASKNQKLSPPSLSKGWKCLGLWYPLQSRIGALYGTDGERDEENPQHISEGNQVCGINTWKSLVNRICFKQCIYKQKLTHKQALELIKEMFDQLHKTMTKSQVLEFFDKNSIMIKKAIKHGTIEIVEECLTKFPYLIWNDLGGQTMIQMAVAERNEKILDLICKFSGKEMMDLISRKDTTGNTLLHHVAKLAPPIPLNSVCGSALQVQRELQWYKGVESIIPEADKDRRNKEGQTAQQLFSEAHKDLVVQGGEWMKNISEACMVVAALIVTVAFAAVFTAPGGYVSDSSSPKNGTPVFLGTKSFTAFAIADALALFSSISSVLMFLAIYTSRHAEQDFYRSLPQKLIIGLTTLFISMATIMVSFGASLFIMLRHRFAWAPYPIAVLSCVPFILFASLQLPLFVEMVHSTYCHSLFRKQRYVRPCNQKYEKEE
ncbi:hypothetical protein MKW98_013476 [Papaver atlanticum]|uniref:PGG domain-containing protein n=1 Tax=Papaver atlanticum TaxID=357466 RepID=A0AAD4XK91_9MAGN|nr:hypothetical protein MKW98_013476 [Papaver atlanticum]